MSNTYKTIIAIITVAILAAGAGIYLNSQNRNVNIQSSVAQTSSTKSASSQSPQVKSAISSSQAIKPISSQTASEVAETPKVGTPPPKVVEVPNPVVPTYNPPIVETPKVRPTNLTYTFDNSYSVRGFLPILQTDVNFLNQNIGDVADYYYNSIKNQYPDQNIYINSYHVQKQDDYNYFIAFQNTTIPQSKEGATIRSFNQKVYKLNVINSNDGVFEETNLKDLYSLPLYNN